MSMAPSSSQTKHKQNLATSQQIEQQKSIIAEKIGKNLTAKYGQDTSVAKSETMLEFESEVGAALADVMAEAASSSAKVAKTKQPSAKKLMKGIEAAAASEALVANSLEAIDVITCDEELMASALKGAKQSSQSSSGVLEYMEHYANALIGRQSAGASLSLCPEHERLLAAPPRAKLPVELPTAAALPDLQAELSQRVPGVESSLVMSVAKQMKKKTPLGSETLNEMCAIHIYTQNVCYREFNAALRSHRHADWANLMCSCASAVAHLPPPKERAPHYRGVSQLFGATEPGEIEWWDAFTSVSTELAVARSFSGGKVIYEVHGLPAGSSGHLSHLSYFPSEKEVLVAPGLCFVVVSHARNTNGAEHYITLLCQDPSAMDDAAQRKACLCCMLEDAAGGDDGNVKEHPSKDGNGRVVDEGRAVRLLQQPSLRQLMEVALPSGSSETKLFERGATVSAQRSRCIDLPCLSSRDEQRSLMHLAASNGLSALLQELLAVGGSPLVADAYGTTPLHDACRLRRFEICGALLAHAKAQKASRLHQKSMVEEMCDAKDGSGRSAWDYAQDDAQLIAIFAQVGFSRAVRAEEVRAEQVQAALSATLAAKRAAAAAVIAQAAAKHQAAERERKIAIERERKVAAAEKIAQARWKQLEQARARRQAEESRYWAELWNLPRRTWHSAMAYLQYRSMTAAALVALEAAKVAGREAADAARVALESASAAAESVADAARAAEQVASEASAHAASAARAAADADHTKRKEVLAELFRVAAEAELARKLAVAEAELKAAEEMAARQNAKSAQEEARRIAEEAEEAELRLRVERDRQIEIRQLLERGVSHTAADLDTHRVASDSSCPSSDRARLSHGSTTKGLFWGWNGHLGVVSPEVSTGNGPTNAAALPLADERIPRRLKRFVATASTLNVFASSDHGLKEIEPGTVRNARVKQIEGSPRSRGSGKKWTAGGLWGSGKWSESNAPVAPLTSSSSTPGRKASRDAPTGGTAERGDLEA